MRPRGLRIRKPSRTRNGSATSSIVSVSSATASASAIIAGTRITIVGIVKGSGMIAPDMATMLAFIVTDADIHPAVLRALLGLHVRTTFNSVTVDGDTSTNDT